MDGTNTNQLADVQNTPWAKYFLFVRVLLGEFGLVLQILLKSCMYGFGKLLIECQGIQRTLLDLTFLDNIDYNGKV